MESKNSYFILDIEDTCVYMRYYPPVNGGEALKIDEVIDVLNRNRIENFDLKQINEALKNAQQPVRFKISDAAALQYSESMDLKVTPDGMYAIVRFFPASNKGQRMSETEIRNDLAHYRIKFGVKEEVIEKHLKSPEYFRNIILAMGQKPVQGKDAFITYHFNTDKKAKPRLNEDGTVDFHQLDNISHVKKGQVIAVLTPEDPGSMGKNVYGADVRPKPVKRLMLKAGKNAVVSDDGLQMLAEVNGHAEIDGDKIQVSDVYEVVADVDNSTGDITYEGDIVVRGNVRTGFRVKAGKNVHVYGVVEGAEIEAGGDVILQRGVQGMGRCVITAGGNLISKFIESATINVDGYVSADSILYSQITAKGDVTVSGKGGSIIGGCVKSTSLISATVIGTGMGTNTVVEVGVDPKMAERLKEIERITAENTKEVEKLSQLLAIFLKKHQMGKLEAYNVPKLAQMSGEIQKYKTETERLNAEYEAKQALLQENQNAKICVEKYVYPGTKIVIAGDYILIHEKSMRCQFKREHCEIVSKAW